MARVGRGHHVLRIEHLLRKLGNSDCAVLLAATCSQRSETSHEEVETRERNCRTRKYLPMTITTGLNPPMLTASFRRSEFS